jgi:hypothetical protein
VLDRKLLRPLGQVGDLRGECSSTVAIVSSAADSTLRPRRARVSARCSGCSRKAMNSAQAMGCASGDSTRYTSQASRTAAASAKVRA